MSTLIETIDNNKTKVQYNGNLLSLVSSVNTKTKIEFRETTFFVTTNQLNVAEETTSTVIQVENSLNTKINVDTFVGNTKIQRAVPVNVQIIQDGGGGTFEGFPVFIQDNQPVTQQEKYLWIQTNVGGNSDDFQFFFEDGL